LTTIDDLTTAGRYLDGLGLCPGRSGNVSVRAGNRILISSSGSSLGSLDASAISVVGLDGEQLGGPPASKELPAHLALYRRDTAHRAVVHLHSPHALAMACLPPWSEHSAMAPITPYFVMRVGRVPLVPYARPGSAELGELLAAARGHFRAALLQNHGSIVAHRTLDDAVDVAIELEEAARLLNMLGERAQPLDADAVAELVRVFGAGW